MGCFDDNLYDVFPTNIVLVIVDVIVIEAILYKVIDEPLTRFDAPANEL